MIPNIIASTALRGTLRESRELWVLRTRLLLLKAPFLKNLPHHLASQPQQESLRRLLTWPVLFTDPVQAHFVMSGFVSYEM